VLATFAFDVCHDVYQAAREAIDNKLPTLNAECSGKYLWRPDRLPRLAEYVCDFALAGERALGGNSPAQQKNESPADVFPILARENAYRESCGRSDLQRRVLSGASVRRLTASPRNGSCKASRVAMFRLYYLGGADYHAARRQMGISELTWADWAEEIRARVGRELTRAGVFPPSRYFRETAAKAS